MTRKGSDWLLRLANVCCNISACGQVDNSIWKSNEHIEGEQALLTVDSQKFIWKCQLYLYLQTDILIPAENQGDGSPTSHTKVTSMSLSFLLLGLRITQRLNDPLQVFLRAESEFLLFFSESWRPVPSLTSCLHLLPGQQRPSRTIWAPSKSWQMTAIFLQSSPFLNFPLCGLWVFDRIITAVV